LIDGCNYDSDMNTIQESGRFLTATNNRTRKFSS